VTYYAHTAEDESGKRLPKSAWQLLKDHLRQVAELASGFASAMALETEAFLAGLLHDLGKYAERFQARLDDNSIHGINHWTVGARKAAELKASLVDYAVDGHHTGLPGAGDLRQSLLKMAGPILTREHTGCAESVAELTGRLVADGVQLPSVLARPQEDSFAAALRTRMLFSCLVDADFLDTEKHFDPTAAAQRVVPSIQPERALGLVQAVLAAKPADGPVNLLRRRLLADCLNASEKPPGLFTLTAPTGSGKTLASLAFALRHIAHHNAVLPAHDPRRFRRVIVVIPYTSIIEQTARAFREILETEFGVD
jgi:CRISPR-associated endonuclease/helicase Cas3